MKLINLFLFSFFIFSCSSDKLETTKAKEVVEKLISSIDKEDYAALAGLYSPDFNSSEPVEERNKKLNTLNELMGSVKSFEVTDSVNESVAGEQAKVVLTYKINRQKVNSIETFTVTYEEGSYRISGHSIKSENL